MICGEGPGWKESQSGRPFVETAPAGAELTRYFNGIRLPLRSDVWITNLIKEWEAGAATKKQDVKPEDIARDDWELKIELQTVQPEIVVALGRHSARWLLGAEVDMEAVNGLLFRVRFCTGCHARRSLLTPDQHFDCACSDEDMSASQFLYVLPVYHPAAGLHRPELAARTAYGFDVLAGLLATPKKGWMQRTWQPAFTGHYVDHTPVDPYDVPYATEQAIDTEGTPDQPWGLSMAIVPGEAAVARFSEWDGLPLFFPLNLPQSTKLVFHNYPWDVRVLRAKDIVVNEDQFDDTMLMAYLLAVEPLGLKALSLRHLGRVRKDYEEVVGEWLEVLGKSGKPLKKKTLHLRSLDEIPRQEATDYAGADADDTLSLKPILWQRVQDLGLEQVYEIDRRVLPLYARMEEVGLPIDAGAYACESGMVSVDLTVETLELCEAAYDAGMGKAFNPASPDQVADLLFTHLHLPWHKKTPTGKRPSTNDKYLQALKHEHPIVQQIIDWRELAKHKNTFIDPLPNYCRTGEDGLRLFFELSPFRVVSGRLAAKNPNVLALPKHSPLGKRFRQMVRAQPGRVLAEWDLNQIELRVLALDSGSTTLRDLFLHGADIHGRTAARIFGGKPEAYADGAKRVAAKATNFSIPMGTTCWGLAEQQRKNGYPFPELNGVNFWSYRDRIEAQAGVCQAWIDAVIKDWAIEGYIAEMHAMARRYGYVQDRWGRKRFLPSVLSPNKTVREEALRQAQAFGPQAGARGFMKQIEARVWREIMVPFRNAGAYIEPLLDVHDALLVECEEGVPIGLLMDAIFNETFADLAIPITAKGKVGACWADL